MNLPMHIQVFYIADCHNRKPTVQRIQNALRSAALPNTIAATITEVEINTAADAEKWHFLGSPSVSINGFDIEPEARTVQHFGLGCRSYAKTAAAPAFPPNRSFWPPFRKPSTGPNSLPALQSPPTPQEPASSHSERHGRCSRFFALAIHNRFHAPDLKHQLYAYLSRLRHPLNALTSRPHSLQNKSGNPFGRRSRLLLPVPTSYFLLPTSYFLPLVNIELLRM